MLLPTASIRERAWADQGDRFWQRQRGMKDTIAIGRRMIEQQVSQRRGTLQP